jgi:cytochrome c peroxidase
MFRIVSLLFLISVFLLSCTQNPNVKSKQNEQAAKADKELLALANIHFKPLRAIAENPNNVVTPEKVNLGKALYFDTRLSKTGNNSCNSCHNLNTFGVDNKPTSEGDAGKFGDRNSPTVLNAAVHTMQFWDGRAKDPVEMDIPSKDFLVKRLKEIEFYKNAFAKAFPDAKDPLTYDNLQKAIGAFERTLLTPSKFDEFLAGNTEALTAEQKQGLQSFINNGCTTCHNGVAVGGNSFQKFGANEDYRSYLPGKVDDEGLKAITKNEADKDKFKVPSLRNVTRTFPYFHNGSVSDLDEAIKIMAKVQLGLELGWQDRAAIIEFLKSLEADIPSEAKKIPAEISAL